MATNRIVGVSGFMRTGKDSVASLLQEFGYTRVSFADPLRKMAADIDPMISLDGTPPDIQNYFLMTVPIRKNINAEIGAACVLYTQLLAVFGYERAKEVPDFRRFLQRLGTEGVRENFGEDAWVDLFREKIVFGVKYVAPDVRFPNEARAIRKLGGEVWRTERPGFDGGTHPSEAMVRQIDPDVMLRAPKLLDSYDEEGIERPGLGTLVLQQLGEDPKEHRDLLSRWASGILSAS